MLGIVLEFGTAGVGAMLTKGVAVGRAAKRAKGLVHLTDNAAGASIAGGGKLKGPRGIYTSTLGTASKTGLAYTARTGVTGATVGFRIPESALGAFKQPLALGPMTLWQRWGGTYYSAAGHIDLASGTFVRTGVKWNQLGIYAFDVGITATTAAAAAYYY